MAYLAAAYGVFWAISFVLVLSMVRRQGQLASRLRVVQNLVEDEPRSKK
jgi:hypothetical protein